MFVLADYLSGVLALDRSAEALEFEGQWFTWGQLADQVAALRAQLSALGLGADSRWASWCATGPTRSRRSSPR